MHLQIKGVGNFDFDGVADAFHGNLAQGDALSVGGQYQAIVAILQHLDVSAGIKGMPVEYILSTVVYSISFILPLGSDGACGTGRGTGRCACGRRG